MFHHRQCRLSTAGESMPPFSRPSLARGGSGSVQRTKCRMVRYFIVGVLPYSPRRVTSFFPTREGPRPCVAPPSRTPGIHVVSLIFQSPVDFVLYLEQLVRVFSSVMTLTRIGPPFLGVSLGYDALEIVSRLAALPVPKSYSDMPICLTRDDTDDQPCR